LTFLWQKHENKILFVLKMISFKEISVSLNKFLFLCERNWICLKLNEKY
jgi:hypothetical protein